MPWGLIGWAVLGILAITLVAALIVQRPRRRRS